MSATKAEEVKVEVPVQGTKPSDPSRRIPDNEIEILPCEPSDAEHLVSARLHHSNPSLTQLPGRSNIHLSL
jgi:hypothetical protein